ncbi:MAG: hypothetical protein VB078_10810 [Clostridiaceae bacterium]|nr:hypothetical protein [Clostridiaceae bacterium]
MADFITKLYILYENEYDLLKNMILDSTGTTFDDPIIKRDVLMSIDRAVKAILRYTGWVDMKTGYESVVCTLAMDYLMTNTQIYRLFMGKPIMSAQTQGSRSATYKADMPTIDGNGLTAEVKAALPLPRLKVFS